MAVRVAGFGWLAGWGRRFVKIGSHDGSPGCRGYGSAPARIAWTGAETGLGAARDSDAGAR